MENAIDNELIDVDDVEQQAQKMLEISDTNKINTVEQATNLTVLETIVDHLNTEGLSSDDNATGHEWDCLLTFGNRIDIRQLVIGAPVNSREAFAQILRAKLTPGIPLPVEQKKKGFLGL
jgi:hypothetical protein